MILISVALLIQLNSKRFSFKLVVIVRSVKPIEATPPHTTFFWTPLTLHSLSFPDCAHVTSLACANTEQSDTNNCPFAGLVRVNLLAGQLSLRIGWLAVKPIKGARLNSVSTQLYGREYVLFHNCARH